MPRNFYLCVITNSSKNFVHAVPDTLYGEIRAHKNFQLARDEPIPLEHSDLTVKDLLRKDPLIYIPLLPFFRPVVSDATKKEVYEGIKELEELLTDTQEGPRTDIAAMLAGRIRRTFNTEPIHGELYLMRDPLKKIPSEARVYPPGTLDLRIDDDCELEACDGSRETFDSKIAELARAGHRIEVVPYGLIRLNAENLHLFSKHSTGRVLFPRIMIEDERLFRFYQSTRIDS